jgi:PAS domain-containing protein
VAPKEINEWLALAGTIGASVTVAIVCARRFKKRFHDLHETVRAHRRFVELFGAEYAADIFKFVNELGSVTDILTTRQDIILRKLGIGIYVCEAKSGKCIFVTERMAEIFGISPAAMLGYGWAAQIDEREKRVEKWNWCVQHEAVYRDEYTVTHGASGKKFRCQTEAYFVDVDGGRYVGYVEVIREGD